MSTRKRSKNDKKTRNSKADKSAPEALMMPMRNPFICRKKLNISRPPTSTRSPALNTTPDLDRASNPPGNSPGSTGNKKKEKKAPGIQLSCVLKRPSFC